jgi:hypothetical protein
MKVERLDRWPERREHMDWLPLLTPPNTRPRVFVDRVKLNIYQTISLDGVTDSYNKIGSIGLRDVRRSSYREKWQYSRFIQHTWYATTYKTLEKDSRKASGAWSSNSGQGTKASTLTKVDNSRRVEYYGVSIPFPTLNSVLIWVDATASGISASTGIDAANLVCISIVSDGYTNRADQRLN